MDISRSRYNMVKIELENYKNIIRDNPTLKWDFVKAAYDEYKAGKITNYQLEDIIDTFYDMRSAEVIEKQLGYKR